MKTRLIPAAALAFSACAENTGGHDLLLAPGSRYVAMGSSYAAGAKIGPQVPQSSDRCGRTENNYAHLLSARLGFSLVDVSCGGATSAHILAPWAELPAQIDALTPETRLVTITIGGNDINYVGNLLAAVCGESPTPAHRSPKDACPPVVWPVKGEYRILEKKLRVVFRQIMQRAPHASLVVVDYLRLLPESGTCADLPLNEEHVSAARESFRRLSEATRMAAAAEGAMLLPAGKLSVGHDACSIDPWAAGIPGRPAAMHPTAAGHRAIADALALRLR